LACGVQALPTMQVAFGLTELSATSVVTFESRKSGA
jgi:hypothetical protein